MKPLRITLFFLIVVLVVGGVIFGIGLLNANSPSKRADELSVLLAAGSYQEADALIEEATHGLEGESLSTMHSALNTVLQQEADRFLIQAAKGPLDEAAQTRYAGMSHLGDTMMVQLAAKTDEWVSSYFDDDITYEQLENIQSNIAALGFQGDALAATLNVIATAKESKAAMDTAQNADSSGDYLAAIQNYAKVLPQDRSNYATAQSRILAIADEQGEALYNAKQYANAVELLKKAQAALPDNPSLAAKLAAYQSALDEHSKNLVLYEGPVEHLFTHCLLAYPELAPANYWTDCITPYEFKKVLQSLYENDFILVNIDDIVSNPSGDDANFEFTKMMLPEGKKPMVWSFDDVVYDARKTGNGMVDKLIIDENGKIASETYLADGSVKVSYDNEFVMILDSFVEEHPDFSFEGAKGAFALTGFQGILGYRTQHDSPKDRDAEIEAAKKVVAKLKENGWTFISHTYGHPHMGSADLAKVADDTQKWQDEVASIVGDTQILVWPYGDRILPSDTARYQVLKDAGFRLFCGVGAMIHNKVESDGTLFMDRATIDGTSLWGFGKYYNGRLFNIDEVRDPIRPKPAS
ncbi:MAG: polysaccharide deacetylase family protein [Christensenellales bacterium]|jgi:tetratricopeptide (TPR) repeat protein